VTVERYLCKECGAEARVDATGVYRTCPHTGIVLLDMQVTCYGKGGLQTQTPTRLERLVHTIIALLPKRA
jgi:hypothetical protein